MRRRQKVFKAIIYLRSGQSFVFDTVILTTERAPTSGELIGIKWETPADTWFRKYRRLAYVRLSDVLSVVAH